MTAKEALEFMVNISHTYTEKELQMFMGAYFIVDQVLTELEELKATIKELLDIPITVSTFNGTSLLVKTMNKLNKLVGDKDE